MIDMVWSIPASMVVALIATGAVAGVLAGLLGVGGGIVIVPVLYHVFTYLGIDESVRMHMAVGTSLATIIPTSIVSARAHFRRGGIEPELLRQWGVMIAIGVVTGTVIGGNVRGEVLTLIFAIIALLVAANMAFSKEGFTLGCELPRAPFKQVIAFFIGLVSVMMGIGGGTLSVPILSAFNYPIRKAVGTASAIGLIIAVPGALGYLYYGLDVPMRPSLSLGYIHLAGFVLIIPTTILTAPLGAKIAHSINSRSLKLVFAFFLFVTSLRMFYGLIW